MITPKTKYDIVFGCLVCRRSPARKIYAEIMVFGLASELNRALFGTESKPNTNNTYFANNILGNLSPLAF